MSRRTRRRSALVAAVVAAAATLSACGPSLPLTQEPYAAGYGFNLTVGALEGLDLLVLTDAEGQPGTVLGAVHNTGDTAVTVQVGSPDAPVSIEVDAGEVATLGPDANEVAVAAVPAPPGALTALTLASDRDGAATIDVPVLDGTLPAYEGLVPGS